jgi:hypothetical protein
MKKLVLFIFLMVSFSNAFSQFQAIRNQADYPFLLHLPADSILKSKPPVLIFLHGRSLWEIVGTRKNNVSFKIRSAHL